MEFRAAIRTIDATLKSRGFREVGPGAMDYEGAIQVHGKDVDVRVSIPDPRFVRKPQIFLKDRTQVPVDVLAHVETEAGICYVSGAGLPVDLYEPGQAILRVIEEAQRTLQLSYRGRGHDEMVEEYQHYWFPKLGAKVFFPRNSRSKVLRGKLFFAERDGKVLFMCIGPRASLRGYDATAPRTVELRYVDASLGPIPGVGAPETAAEFETWFKAQPALKAHTWQSTWNWLVAGNALFFAAPNVMLGLTFVRPRQFDAAVMRGAIRPIALPKILQAHASTIQLSRLAGNWCSIDDVSARNNVGTSNLLDISIAVVGCGTIGSHLAKMLIQSGAGGRAKLSVFDTELFSEGNLGRHLLGFEFIGQPKATALKTELERYHPQVQVDAYPENALDLWPILASHDLVIDATGEWNVQSALNDLFMIDTVRPKALLHSWVFMNGAGAQSFLNLHDEYACFRCLKPDLAGPWRFPAGDEKEELNLQPASCGDGSFVPFTVDASAVAASLANRAALDWAKGSPGARLRTQVVDLDRGIYQKPRHPTPAPNCPACSGLRGAA